MACRRLTKQQHSADVMMRVTMSLAAACAERRESNRLRLRMREGLSADLAGNSDGEHLFDNELCTSV